MRRLCHEHIAYNSCRNRHCPKCQSGAAKTWLAAREAELLPVRYFHLVFTLPRQIADIAHQNQREIYNLLMRVNADTVIKIAADPKHLGARAGKISVLHTWGSAMTHHPHVHMIVPGGSLSTDGTSWIACRKNFFLSVRVLSRLYRRLIVEGLSKLHKAGKLQFFGDHADLIDRNTFDDFLQPLRKTDWVVYAKEPFAGPKSVLADLSRYTHRVAISNSRLIRFDAQSVAFRVKDYRLKGAGRHTTMTLATNEFIRRFLIHVLPKGQHRIRHYCWAHARRKLYELTHNNVAPIAEEGLKQIGALYRIEAQGRGKSADEPLAMRQSKSTPKIAAFKTWLDYARTLVSAKSPTGEALKYIANYWDGLILFLDDGRIEMDSNAVERTIRPIANG